MIGKMLGNRYEIIEQIGGGGMALVYKAKCHLLDRFVAIKILKDEYVNDEDFVKKFRRESQAAASLSHPNIVNIYDVGVETENDKQTYYIVMEYIKGKTLKEIIVNQKRIPVDQAVDYSYQIAEALQHAHGNHIVHRDIKPQNIMITDDNRVKVTDFGIARAATSSTVTTTSNVLGSVHYFSPEQARGGYTDEKSDIYSLGIVMYEMATGRLPYQGESPITVALKHVQEDIKPPREWNADIPVIFENIILKCVEKRQADRYLNINELLKDLRKVKGKSHHTTVDIKEDYDSHTKIIPTINVAEDDEKMKNKKVKQNKNKKDGTLKVVLLGILLAFLLASSIWFGYFKLKEFLGGGEVVTVPKIVGMQEAEAKEEIEKLGLVFEVIARVDNDKYPQGQVISQSEEEGTKLKQGFRVEVTVSQGEDVIKVPSVVNRDLKDAQEILSNAGLSINSRIEYEYSDTIPADVVIKQDPESGTEVAPGTKISLVVSQGSEVKMITMPKLVGKNINDAKNELFALDLIVGEVVEQDSLEHAKDIVTWQSYIEGTEIETKTVVDLYISKGTTEPTNPTEPPEPTNPEEPNTGNVEGPITITLSPYADVPTTEIKIVRIQDGISEVVYQETKTASDGDYMKTLSGKKGAIFEIYYNDKHITNITKDFE